MSLRRPPVSPHAQAPRGRCRWCGEAVLYPVGHKRAGEENRRRNWHDGRGDEPDCLTIYKVAHHSAAQRRALWQRDRDLCAGCGHHCNRAPVTEWAADHIRPLWSVPRDLPFEQAIFFWSLDNLQTLCLPCHAEKTKREAAERAKADRQRKHHETGRGRARKGRALEGRGFDKSLSRKFDGTVVRREG